MPRIVSLVPSITETLVALGAPPVGCTRFCKQPGIPTVGGTKNPDIERIERLLPLVVLVNDEENRIEDVRALDDLGIHTVSVSPRSVEEVGPAILAIARAAEVAAPEGFDEPSWTDWVGNKRRSVPARRAFVPVWARPWMTLNGATYASSLLALLGVDNVYADDPTRYPEVRIEQVRERRPDLVLLPTEPYPFHDRHAERVGEAFPEAAVSLIDGEDLFWWGIRTPHAIRRLSGALAAVRGPAGGGTAGSADGDGEFEEPGLP